MSGAFYPTGYVVVMFPDEQQAEQVAHELVNSGYDGKAIMVLRPETILLEIGHADDSADLLDLPSVVQKKPPCNDTYNWLAKVTML